MRDRMRYVLCRPRGGFNDCMVQIALCRAYAAAHGRDLIVDTQRSGLQDALSRYFTPLDGFGVPCREPTEALMAELNRLDDVLPAEVAHRLGRYETVFAEGNYRLRESGTLLSFDHGRDHAERLLVQEQCRGGIDSLLALQHMALTPPVADTLARRLLSLGPDYDAVHVRHSDYRSDFERLLRRIAPALKGRRVLLCTDSHVVQRAARGLLSGCAEVMTLSEVPDTGGLPLHETEGGDVRGRNIDMLSDLVALAAARRLYFGSVSGGGIDKVNGVISGFSQLAEALRRNPQLLVRIFSAASPKLRDPLVAQLQGKGRGALTPAQRLAALRLWRVQRREDPVLRRNLRGMSRTLRHFRRRGRLWRLWRG